MKIRSIKFTTILIVLTAFAISCNSKHHDEQNQNSEPDISSYTELTRQQFEANNMQLGEVSLKEFNNSVECNGYIRAKPNGMAMINTRIGGVVEKVNVAEGDVVKKGTVICELTSAEFISIQKDYAEATARLLQLESNYKRSKSLYEQNIGSEKDFIAAESNYKAMMAQHKALKMQLKLLGLDVNKVEQNNFYQTCPVIAPIPGIISEVDVNIGQYIEPQEKLMEIVNRNDLQLVLSVFEENIKFIKTGQDVWFTTINNPDTVYDAVIKSIGKSLNSKTKTITCLADINKNHNDFINNSFIRAQIVTNKQKVTALPEEALIKSGDNYYVLELVKTEGDIYYFKKVKVNPGKKYNRFIEIKNSIIKGEVLIKGGYNLQVDE